jgi:hypothetical protein
MISDFEEKIKDDMNFRIKTVLLRGIEFATRQFNAIFPKYKRDTCIQEVHIESGE